MNTSSSIQLTGARRRGLALILAAGLSVFPAAFGQSEPISWSLGFEEGEGYEPGPLAANASVSLLGGSAEILRGEGALEGRQWLRFEPSAPENGLFISLPESPRGAGERTLRFQARLAGDSPDARLVIAYGETLSVRPVEGGIELETPGAPPNFFPVAGVESGDWIDVELRQRSDDEAWDLYAWGELLKADIPTQVSRALENLLIFADGAVDLDAIHANAALGQARQGETGGPSDRNTATGGREASGEAGKRSDPPKLGLRDAAFFEIDLPEAIRSAGDGKLAEAEQAVSRRSQFERGSALWHFEQAQALSMVAFTLRQKGQNRASVAGAREILHHLELAQRKLGAGEHEQQQVDAAFLEARVLDYLLGDAEKARAAYDRTLQKSPEHASAKRAAARLDAPSGELDRDEPRIGEAREETLGAAAKGGAQ